MRRTNTVIITTSLLGSLGLISLGASAITPTAMAQSTPDIRPVLNEETGFWEAELPSEYQAHPAKVEILLPKDMPASDKRLPVLYILPVGGPPRAGGGLVEAKKADIANKYGVICVSPYFTSIPWIGNHVTDPKIQQESHMLNVVVPWIDGIYPTQADAEGRWLIGFSKSGWSACTLLMRHPDVFGYACAWDVPFMLNGEDNPKDWGPYGLSENFGTKEQMQMSLPTRLAQEHADRLKDRKRLVIGVGDFWKSQSMKYHEFLDNLGIPHVYRDDLVFKHAWETGWFGPMADDLVGIARLPRPAP